MKTIAQYLEEHWTPDMWVPGGQKAFDNEGNMTKGCVTNFLFHEKDRGHINFETNPHTAEKLCPELSEGGLASINNFQGRDAAIAAIRRAEEVGALKRRKAART